MKQHSDHSEAVQLVIALAGDDEYRAFLDGWIEANTDVDDDMARGLLAILESGDSLPLASDPSFVRTADLVAAQLEADGQTLHADDLRRRMALLEAMQTVAKTLRQRLGQ